MALLGAVAMANAWQGAMYMLLFGLGTIPLMTTVYFSSWFGQSLTKISKAIPVFVVIIGVLFIIRGLGLGIPFSAAPAMLMWLLHKYVIKR